MVPFLYDTAKTESVTVPRVTVKAAILNPAEMDQHHDRTAHPVGCCDRYTFFFCSLALIYAGAS